MRSKPPPPPRPSTGRIMILLACVSGLAGAAGLGAQEAWPREPAPQEPPRQEGLSAPGVPGSECRGLPVHTAALTERVRLAELGGVPGHRRGEPPVGSAAAWRPESRLSDRVRDCVAVGLAGPLGVMKFDRYWVAPLPAAVEARHSTTYPRTMVDGSFRPGVGPMVGLVGGITAGVGPLTLVVRPELHHHRNTGFDMVGASIPGYSPFIHATVGTRIDLPQRFGARPFTVLSPGQTTLRLDLGPAVVGVSTENAVWGPGLRNPLLLSSAAPGLPHFFLGTNRPVDIRIGNLFLRTLVARTTESDFFDGDPANDHLLLSGTIASIEPAPLPGLTLGVSRFFAVQDGPDVGWGTFLRAAFTNLQENPQGTDPFADNQYASVFARWAFPEAGLEVYGEFARNDHWQEWLELIKSPQAAGGWMAGLQKVFPGESVAWRVLAEAANLVDPIPTQLPNRPGAIHWYTHSQLRQGHTHRGQLLGAPIGPGGRQQVVAIDRYSPAVDLGVEIARSIFNDDVYNQTWWRHFNVFGHDAELSALVRGRRPVGRFDLHGALGYSHRWNRSFIDLPAMVGTAWELEDLRKEGSWSLEVRGVWARP
jgi:hypothetical protein